MCRHAAYAGPPIAVSTLLCDMEHGLLHQSYAPRELLVGTVCADGYGAAWYNADSGTDAVRYAHAQPIWADQNLATMLPRIQSTHILAAVRNGTVAGQNTEANCAPFTVGRLSLSHNGFLEDYDASWRADLRAMAGAAEHDVRGTTDSEMVFAMIRAALGDPSDDSALATAVQQVCRTLVEEAARRGKHAQLNLLLSDGDQIIATRCGSRPTQNSLYVLVDGDEFPAGIVVASEPLYDDPEWQVVQPDTLLVARPGAPLVRMRI